MLNKSPKEKTVGDIKLRVLDVEKEGAGGKLAHIEITDKEGKGQAKLTTWSPNTRNKMATIQVGKSNKGQLRHVDILATKVVRPLLDKLMNGETVKNLAKTFFKDPKIVSPCETFDCTICGRVFKMERYMKSHMTKMHGTIHKLARHEETEQDGDSSHIKPEQSVSKSDQCGFKTMSKPKLKRNKKKPDKHTSPASPERKKIKLASDMSKEIVEEIIESIQDTEDTEAETDKELKNMETISFEEKRVDDQLMDTKTEEEKLSDQNDEKIRKKQLKIDEEEKLQQIAKDRNMQILKQAQNGENAKRKRESSHKVKRSKATNMTKNTKLPSGFKEIPNNLRRHFPDNHVILTVKPDGLCGVTCGAAHIFAQPHKSHQFREQLNKHIVSHWTYYKNKIAFPYERQVGVEGEHAVFTDPQEFLDFLLSPASSLLWTDTEEILAMCNQYQMAATVVKVVEGKGDPVILELQPDPDILQLGLPDTALIPGGKLPTMILLLQGAHYSLAIPEESIRDKYTTQENDGYKAEEEEDENPAIIELESTEEKFKDMETKFC